MQCFISFETSCRENVTWHQNNPFKQRMDNVVQPLSFILYFMQPIVLRIFTNDTYDQISKCYLNLLLSYIVFSVYETYFLSLKYQQEPQKASLTRIKILTFTKKEPKFFHTLLRVYSNKKLMGGIEFYFISCQRKCEFYSIHFILCKFILLQHAVNKGDVGELPFNEIKIKISNQTSSAEGLLVSSKVPL